MEPLIFLKSMKVGSSSVGRLLNLNRLSRAAVVHGTSSMVKANGTEPMLKVFMIFSLHCRAVTDTVGP